MRATFEGYLRPNGKTGTRNYIGILTSVNCSASVAKFIAEEVNRSGILDDHPEIDGAVAFVHEIGRGLVAYDADDAEKIKGRSSADVLLILGYTGRTEMIHRDDLVLGGE